MRSRYLSARAFVAFIGTVAAIAGVTYGALAVAGVDFGSSGSAEPSQPDANSTPDTNSAKYLADNRDRLAICVQSQVPVEAVQSEAMDAIGSAIVEVSEDAAWIEQELSSPQPLVSAGCPSSPRIFQPDIPVVAEPSYYRVHVFVLAKSDLEKIFGDQQVRRAAEEKVCGGDFCWEVTTGIYLSPDELSDTGLVSNALRYGVGLR